VHDLETDDLIERVALELRRPVDYGAHVDDAVMAAIRSAPLRLETPNPRADRARVPAARAGALGWLLRPRTLRVSPLVGVAAAAAVAMLVMSARWLAPEGAAEARLAGAAATTPETVRHDTVHVTHFMLIAPGATSVSVVGDFNDWDGEATPLRLASNDGVWSVDLPLPPGRYKYNFLVDGKRFVADPVAPRAVDAEFGTPNSVVTVRGADT
jgi:hypothetical protein